MTTALTFIKLSNLDSEVIDAYRKTRMIAQKNNFTEEELKTVTRMPNEMHNIYMYFHGKIKKLYGDLHKYGFTNHPDQLPDDVQEYLMNKLEEINKEISMEGNTGYYGDKGPFHSDQINF